MLQKVFDSQDCPAQDRMDAYYDLVARSRTPIESSIEDDALFQASVRAATLGDALVRNLTYTSSLTARRTRKLIQSSDPGFYGIELIMRGGKGVVQERSQATLGPRDLMVYSDWRPFDITVQAPDGIASGMLVLVPHPILAVPERRLATLLATPLPGGEGAGGLLAAFLTQLARDTSPSSPADSHRLGGVLLDLITVWLAHHVDAECHVPVESRQRVQFLELTSFIHRHLADPALSPISVAAAHHLSLRSLHRLFQRHDTTVAAYIRDQRLARARRDLADPRLAARPIRAIAARWGFPRPADFTRAFRNAYGVPPSEYRCAAAHRTPDPGAQR